MTTRSATDACPGWRRAYPDSPDQRCHHCQRPRADHRMSGAALIVAERQRQVEVEGWTPEHDAEHWNDDLAMAAVCYATPPARRKPEFVNQRAMRPDGWPWDLHFWKPTPDDRVRELVKAGALIAAEIDRLRAPDGGPDDR